MVVVCFAPARAACAVSRLGASHADLLLLCRTRPPNAPCRAQADALSALERLRHSPDLSVREEATKASLALGQPPASVGGADGEEPSEAGAAEASTRAAAAAAAMGAVGRPTGAAGCGRSRAPLPACRVSAPGEPLEPPLAAARGAGCAAGGRGPCGHQQPLSDLSWRAHNEQIRQLIGKASALSRVLSAARCAVCGARRAALPLRQRGRAAAAVSPAAGKPLPPLFRPPSDAHARTRLLSPLLRLSCSFS